MGNPHCVTFVENVDEFPVDYVGPTNRARQGLPQEEPTLASPKFLSKNEMKLRVWERGCGETLACGTGTCAAVAAANKLGKVGSKVTVHVLGGDLQVEVADTLFLSWSS